MNLHTIVRHIKALIIKEFTATLQDPRSRFIIIVPPLLQLFIFANSASMEIRNVNLAILNYDNSKIASSFLYEFKNAKFVKNYIEVKSINEINKLITDQKINMGIIINNDFSSCFKNNNRIAKIQTIFDGRQTNVANILSGYANLIANNFVKKELGIQNNKIEISETNFYNPNLEFIWFTVISLVGILSAMTGLVLTSLSIANEKEKGTFDEILISPLSSFEILLGKTIPALIISFGVNIFMTISAIIIYRVPFLGSSFLFIVSSIIFILSILSVGLFLSSISKTQQQAIFLAFTFFVPTVMTSGYVSPIENMPKFFQFIASLNPLNYYFVIIKGIFLKNINLIPVLKNLIPLLTITFIMMILTYYVFEKKNFDA